MWTTLLLIVPPVVIAILVWNFRRQAAAREAASAARMKALLGDTGLAAKPQSAPSAQAPQSMEPMAVTPAAAQSKPQPVVTGFTARAQLVGAAHLPVYQWLQSALPQHTVLPCMSLAAFIQPADTLTGFAREAQVRRLTDATVDFLICSRSLKPLLAVQCGARSGKAAEAAAFTAACVLSAGVRWKEMSPDALATPDAIRAWMPDA